MCDATELHGAPKMLTLLELAHMFYEILGCSGDSHVCLALAHMFATEPHVALEMLTFLEFEQMFDAAAAKLPKLHGARKISTSLEP